MGWHEHQSVQSNRVVVTCSKCAGTCCTAAPHLYCCVPPVSVLYCRYDEYRFYSYNNPGFSEATGHFTQVSSRVAFE
jgi:hypothetical protein